MMDEIGVLRHRLLNIKERRQTQIKQDSLKLLTKVDHANPIETARAKPAYTQRSHLVVCDIK